MDAFPPRDSQIVALPVIAVPPKIKTQLELTDETIDLIKPVFMAPSRRLTSTNQQVSRALFVGSTGVLYLVRPSGGKVSYSLSLAACKGGLVFESDKFPTGSKPKRTLRVFYKGKPEPELTLTFDAGKEDYLSDLLTVLRAFAQYYTHIEFTEAEALLKDSKRRKSFADIAKSAVRAVAQKPESAAEENVVKHVKDVSRSNAVDLAEPDQVSPKLQSRQSESQIKTRAAADTGDVQESAASPPQPPPPAATAVPSSASAPPFDSLSMFDKSRKIISDVYTLYNPDQMGNIDELLGKPKYNGKEIKLAKAVVDRYVPEDLRPRAMQGKLLEDDAGGATGEAVAAEVADAQPPQATHQAPLSDETQRQQVPTSSNWESLPIPVDPSDPVHSLFQCRDAVEELEQNVAALQRQCEEARDRLKAGHVSPIRLVQIQERNLAQLVLQVCRSQQLKLHKEKESRLESELQSLQTELLRTSSKRLNL